MEDFPIIFKKETSKYAIMRMLHEGKIFNCYKIDKKTGNIHDITKFVKGYTDTIENETDLFIFTREDNSIHKYKLESCYINDNKHPILIVKEDLGIVGIGFTLI